MALSEADRTDLYTALVEAHGPNLAEIMMSAYKLHDLDEVATKRDLADLRAEIKSDFTRLSFILVGGFFGVIAALIGVGLLN